MDARPGFQRLVTKLCAGEVGAVLSIEASRLARNGRDWHHLIDLCALSSTLVIDGEGVYDPRSSNDRLLLGVKGTMSEFELSLLRERSFEALRLKARRGALRFRLPIGLCWNADKIVLDPDRRIQEAVRLVFRKFSELDSVRQVFLWFRNEKIELPATTFEDSKTKVVWQLPKYGTLFKMLTNPQYAGAYVFGKTGDRTQVVDGKAAKTRGHAKPREQWAVLIRDHHPGYVSWETFERNSRVMAENAHMKHRMERKAGRGGRALLGGLLRCRRCGRMVRVAYCGTNGSNCRYICHGTQLTDGAQNTCIAFGGLRSDQAVAAALLDVVQPKAIDAALAAIARVTNARTEEARAVTLELEQARYEATLASRRYEAVDPDNRLVAGELESRWNACMRRARELEERVEAMTRAPPTAAPVDRGALLSLAANLPEVWNSPAADMRLKQRIVRMLVQEIVADVDEATNEIVLVVHWIGGRHTQLRVQKPTPGKHGRGTSEDCLALIKGMVGRWSDEDIAATLNRIGRQTGTGKAWTDLRVYQVRHRLGLPAHDASVARTTVTLQDACLQLGVSNTAVKKMIKAKILPAMQGAPFAPWEIEAAGLDTPAVKRAVARIRKHGASMRAAYADKRSLTLPGMAATD
jgi:DNA invertase Pin-like site-specific DNA recombinase